MALQGSKLWFSKYKSQERWWMHCPPLLSCSVSHLCIRETFTDLTPMHPRFDLRPKFQNNWVFKLFGPLIEAVCTLSTSPQCVWEELIMQTDSIVCMLVLYVWVCVSGSLQGALLRGWVFFLNTSSLKQCKSESHSNQPVSSAWKVFHLVMALQEHNGVSFVGFCKSISFVSLIQSVCVCVFHLSWKSLNLFYHWNKTAHLVWTQALLDHTGTGSNFTFVKYFPTLDPEISCKTDANM